MEPQFPNICGVDLGSWTTKVSLLKDNRYFEIITNQANFRETPSIVAFSDAQRLIGESGLIKMKSNFKNTVRAPLRLFSIAYRPSIQEEQLKYLTIPYSIDSNFNLQLKISAKSLCKEGHQFYQLRIEQFVISLLEKVFQIIRANTNHSSNQNYWLYLTIPSYFSNAERKALKNCVEIAGFTTAGLVEEWEALSFEYQFFRVKELQNEADSRFVVIIDFGYSKFSIHICQIDRKNIRLVDQEVLKCTGARNMDEALVDFYIELFRKQTGQNLRKNQKALVKLYENVENQRKKLSANHEAPLNIQCILGDHDLVYNMKREQMENIVMPIFGELASAMQNIKSRAQPYIPFSDFHSIQIVGGASRMPFFQEMIKNIFGVQPSKTLNTSEAMARGVSIAGSARHGALHHKLTAVNRVLHYNFFACIHVLTKDKPYNKNLNSYDLSLKKVIWKAGQSIPSNSSLKIPTKSEVQVILFRDEGIGEKVIGYYRFKEEECVTFLIDNDYIIRARLSKKDKFQIYDMGDILTTDSLVQLRENKKELQIMDSQYLMSYQLRNNYESQIYKNREKVNGSWRPYLDQSQKQYLQDVLNECEKWLGEAKNPSCEELTQRIESLQEITEFVRLKIQEK